MSELLTQVIRAFRGFVQGHLGTSGPPKLPAQSLKDCAKFQVLKFATHICAYVLMMQK